MLAPVMNSKTTWQVISNAGGCALILVSAWIFLVLVLSVG